MIYLTDKRKDKLATKAVQDSSKMDSLARYVDAHNALSQTETIINSKRFLSGFEGQKLRDGHDKAAKDNTLTLPFYRERFKDAKINLHPDFAGLNHQQILKVYNQALEFQAQGIPSSSSAIPSPSVAGGPSSSSSSSSSLASAPSSSSSSLASGLPSSSSPSQQPWVKVSASMSRNQPTQFTAGSSSAISPPVGGSSSSSAAPPPVGGSSSSSAIPSPVAGSSGTRHRSNASAPAPAPKNIADATGIKKIETGSGGPSNTSPRFKQ